MSPRKLALLFFAVLLSAAGCSLLNNETPSPSAESVATATQAIDGFAATVGDIENEVEAHGVQNAPWEAAFDGQSIGQGGEVRTLTEASARLDFTDGSLLRLAPDSLIEITRYEEDRLSFDLTDGRLWLNVADVLVIGNIQVETPVGVAAVRGSVMGVVYDAVRQYMLTVCLHGACSLFNALGQVDLLFGQQSDIPGAGQAPTAAVDVDPLEIIEAAKYPELAEALRKYFEQQAADDSEGDASGTDGEDTSTGEGDAGSGDGAGDSTDGTGSDQSGDGSTSQSGDSSSGDQPSNQGGGDTVLPVPSEVILRFVLGLLGDAQITRPSTGASSCTPGEWTACGGKQGFVSCPSDHVGFCKDDGTWVCLLDTTTCKLPEEDQSPQDDQSGGEDPQVPVHTNVRRSGGPQFASNYLLVTLIVAFGLTYRFARKNPTDQD